MQGAVCAACRPSQSQLRALLFGGCVCVCDLCVCAPQERSYGQSGSVRNAALPQHLLLSVCLSTCLIDTSYRYSGVSL